MRKYLIILFVCLLPFIGKSTTYYVSASGSAGNNGTTTSTTWTLAKVNSFTFSAGDNILFNRGDVFYGTITVSQSGTSGNPITFGAYGSGNNPVITGFTTVSTWTNLGSNIWESTSAVSTLSSCNMVTIGGVNTAMGRYPNTGWLTYQSYSGKTSITSSSLTGTPNWTGANVVVKKFRYHIENDPITAQSGGTLTYSGGVANGQNNWGFFIQNDLRTLDVQNEWYYNPSTKKIDVYSTSSPANVNVSSLTNLFYATNKNYIIVDGLTFTGASGDAVYIGNFQNSTIQNCTFDLNYSAIGGYQYGGSSTVTINNNTINHSGTGAINLTPEFAGSTISNNLIKNTGLFEGMAGSGQTRWGINVTGASFTISGNEVDSTGYTGIGFNGSSNTIQNNFVNYYCLTTDDGGGIYTGGIQTNVIIQSNIVTNGIGNYSGSTYTTPSANGIYCDDNSSGMTLLNNSIGNVAFAAIFLHKASNITVRGNTTYNANIGLLVDRDDDTAHTTGLVIKKNTFVGTSSGSMNTITDQISLWMKTGWTTTGDIANFGVCDSNYLARPIADNNTIMGTVYGVADTYYSLSAWRTYSGYDVHSSASPKTITNAGDLIFVYNATGSSAASSLGYQYIDIANNAYNSGSITLPAYSSAVLIANGALAAIITSLRTRLKFKNRS